MKLQILAVMLILAMAARPSLPQQPPEPLAQDQLMTLVKAGMGTPELVRLIHDHGINFDLTDAYLQALRKAGAQEAVIQAIHAVARPKPLTQDQVMELVAQGVSSERAAALVRQRGIDFKAGEEYLKTLRLAGGDDTLITALREASAALAARLKDIGPPPRQARENSKDGLKYVWIPPGTFMMGCSPGAQCFNDAKPSHEVTLTKGFWMGQTEVTQQAYTRLAGSNPSQFVGLQRPVENVAWNQAKTFCEEAGGRLPTEAQWEYAARAGTTREQYGDLDAISWHSENSGGQTHNVMQKQPNAWGLYDMLGNVWEWVSDLWSGYAADHVIDPKGPPSGQGRIMRGGSYAYRIWGSSASSRYMVGPPPHGGAIGFRCVVDSL